MPCRSSSLEVSFCCCCFGYANLGKKIENPNKPLPWDFPKGEVSHVIPPRSPCYTVKRAISPISDKKQHNMNALSPFSKLTITVIIRDIHTKYKDVNEGHEMKDTGMIRSLDSLGRIVVPVEIRVTRNIDIGDPIEFFILNEEIIVLRKYTSTECTFCRSLDHVTYYKDQFICSTCLKELERPWTRI
jgi:bifunctional DNA-binding transcriptional regulator/antitoxin component of YhaV-PrlF toxin-antitoxin module